MPDVPTSLLCDTQLSAGARVLAAQMWRSAELADDGRLVVPRTNEAIAESAGLVERTALRYLRELRDRGWLRRPEPQQYGVWILVDVSATGGEAA